MKSMIYLVVAECVFIASFFFPSYADIIGYSCARFCLWDVWSYSSGMELAYYFPFTASNLMMILVPMLLFTALKNIKVPVWLIGGQIILLGHVISWPIVNYTEGTLAKIGAGYYIWLFSMVLMLGCTLTKKWSK